MNKYLSGIVVSLSCLSTGVSAEQCISQKPRERICYQTFWGSIIPISCQNVQSILAGKEIHAIPTIKKGPYKGLSQIRDNEGNLLIGIVSWWTPLFRELKEIGFKRPDYDDTDI
jgi:hypothetical protein